MVEITDDLLQASNQIIFDRCLAYFQEQGSRPLIARAEEIMDTAGFPMHYPCHHYLIPALLLSECRKQQGVTEDVMLADLEEARKRALNVPGGFCGFYGTCGTAVGLGIFWSIITDSSPVSQLTWGYGNQACGQALVDLAACGGPRCCKRSTFMTLTGAAPLIAEKLGLKMPLDAKPVCHYYDDNEECLGLNCPYYPEEA